MNTLHELYCEEEENEKNSNSRSCCWRASTATRLHRLSENDGVLYLKEESIRLLLIVVCLIILVELFLKKI